MNLTENEKTIIYMLLFKIKYVNQSIIKFIFEIDNTKKRALSKKNFPNIYKYLEPYLDEKLPSIKIKNKYYNELKNKINNEFNVSEKYRHWYRWLNILDKYCTKYYGYKKEVER